MSIPTLTVIPGAATAIPMDTPVDPEGLLEGSQNMFAIADYLLTVAAEFSRNADRGDGGAENVVELRRCSGTLEQMAEYLQGLGGALAASATPDKP